MNFEALVKAITENVLAELRACGAAAPALLPQASGPRVLALAAPDSAGAASLEAELRERLGQNIRLEFFTPGGAGAGHKYDHYILPRLCCHDMAALATGRATGPITRKALELMLAGEKIAVLEFEYTRYAASAPRALYSLYAGYEKDLAAFGLAKFTAKAPGTAALARTHDGLITEKVIKDAAKNIAGSGLKTLCVPSGAIITALALDAARELGISILKDGAI